MRVAKGAFPLSPSGRSLGATGVPGLASDDDKTLHCKNIRQWHPCSRPAYPTEITPPFLPVLLPFFRTRNGRSHGHPRDAMAPWTWVHERAAPEVRLGSRIWRRLSRRSCCTRRRSRRCVGGGASWQRRGPPRESGHLRQPGVTRAGVRVARERVARLMHEGGLQAGRTSGDLGSRAAAGHRWQNLCGDSFGAPLPIRFGCADRTEGGSRFEPPSSLVP